MSDARNSTPTRMFGPGLEAAAELVGAVLQDGARELHGPHALVALAVAAVVQVGGRALRSRQRAARRALDRVAHRVVAEDVAKAVSFSSTAQAARRGRFERCASRR